MIRFPRSSARPSSAHRTLLPLLLLAAPATLLHANQPSVTFNGAQTQVVTGLTSPWGVAVDAVGNAYVLDASTSLITEIPADDSAPISIPVSGLNQPYGLAVDTSGNLFIADFGTGDIIELPAGGGPQVTFVTGVPSPLGIAVDSHGNVFYSSGTHAYEIAAGQKASVTLPVTLGYAELMTVDHAGNLFIADAANGSVVELPWTGSAWGSQANVMTLLNIPQAVAVDAAGDLFASSFDSSNVTEVPAGGNSTVIASIPGTSGLAVDSNGNLFVASYAQGYLAELQFNSVNLRGQPIASPGATQSLSFAINGGGIDVPVSSIAVLTQGATGLDFADAGSSTCAPGNYLRDITCVVNVAFTPHAPGPRSGAVVFSNGTNVLASVPLYGVGTGPQVVFRPGTLSSLAKKLGGNPYFVASDSSGNLFLTDAKNMLVEEIFAPAYNTVRVLAPAYTHSPGFKEPFGLAIDGAGNLFVADIGDGSVKEILAAGGYNFAVNVANIGYQIAGIALDASGNLFLAVPNQKSVMELFSSTHYQSGRNLPAVLDGPFGLAVDTKGNIFVSSFNKAEVQQISPTDGYTSVQTFPTQATGFGLLALDPAGNIYVADSGSTLGDGAVEELLVTAGYQFATSLGGKVGNPIGIAVGPQGNVWLADYAVGQISRLDFATPPSLAFKNTRVNSSTLPTVVEVANIGNQPLIFTGVSYPTDFPESEKSVGVLPDAPTNAQFCSISHDLQAGGYCQLVPAFAPLSTGWHSENLNLTDNALNLAPATQLIPLQGTGLAATQTITFPSVPTQTVNTTLTLPATASSGLAVSYTSLTPATCSASGSTASFVGGGICRFKASQPGNSAYGAAPDVYQYFWVNLKTQTVSFALVPTQHLLTNSTLSATATSSLAVSFSSLTPAVCTVSATTLTPVAVGTCSLKASQPGNSTYASAVAYQTLHVALANQTINFQAPVNGSVRAKLYLSASATSGLPVSYASFSPSICTVSGNALTLVASGPCSIQATQPGNATYAPALAANQIIKVLPN